MGTVRRILCVDDDPDARALLEIALATVGGFDLQFCASGEQALGAIPEFAPDLVILDVKMPGLNGPETLDGLRKRSNGSDCPVIFLTAVAQPEILESLGGVGAAAIVTKPFDPMTLADTVREFLDR